MHLLKDGPSVLLTALTGTYKDKSMHMLECKGQTVTWFNLQGSELFLMDQLLIGLMALIRMGGQQSYWAVTGRPSRPTPLFGSAGADIIFSEF